jgi:hexokinase
MFEAHDAILAVDIGGTNIRAGVVALNLKKAPDLSKAAVWKFELWRHGDEKKLKR